MPLYLHPTELESHLILLWLQEVKEGKSTVHPSNRLIGLNKMFNIDCFSETFRFINLWNVVLMTKRSYEAPTEGLHIS